MKSGVGLTTNREPVVSHTLNFGLTVEGTTNPAVTLQVNGVPGGNTTIGTAVVSSGGARLLW
jgi:hypothetical protein